MVAEAVKKGNKKMRKVKEKGCYQGLFKKVKEASGRYMKGHFFPKKLWKGTSDLSRFYLRIFPVLIKQIFEKENHRGQRPKAGRSSRLELLQVILSIHQWFKHICTKPSSSSKKSKDISIKLILAEVMSFFVETTALTNFGRNGNSSHLISKN